MPEWDRAERIGHALPEIKHLFPDAIPTIQRLHAEDRAKSGCYWSPILIEPTGERQPFTIMLIE